MVGEVFYNFIRKHQTIKCCPYELATDLELDNPNKWLGLIEVEQGLFFIICNYIYNI